MTRDFTDLETLLLEFVEETAKFLETTQVSTERDNVLYCETNDRKKILESISKLKSMADQIFREAR